MVSRCSPASWLCPWPVGPHTLPCTAACRHASCWCCLLPLLLLMFLLLLPLPLVLLLLLVLLVLMPLPFV